MEVAKNFQNTEVTKTFLGKHSSGLANDAPDIIYLGSDEQGAFLTRRTELCPQRAYK